MLGAAGRMGATVCEAVRDDPDLELVAAVDAVNAGGVAAGGVTIAADAESLVDSGAEVVVDFTVVSAALTNLPKLAAAGIHAVVGTSGFGEAEVAAVRSAFTKSNCLIAPNFAIGAVLMMRFAELAAPFFESGEIIEMHHDNKVDAPSGTAMATLTRMEAASAAWSADPTRHEVMTAARGAAGDAGVRVHSVRMRGLVAHQEVLLGTTGQWLTIRHDTTDRTSFMPGVVLAIKRIGGVAGVTVGLDGLLGI